MVHHTATHHAIKTIYDLYEYVLHNIHFFAAPFEDPEKFSAFAKQHQLENLFLLKEIQGANIPMQDDVLKKLFSGANFYRYSEAILALKKNKNDEKLLILWRIKKTFGKPNDQLNDWELLRVYIANNKIQIDHAMTLWKQFNPTKQINETSVVDNEKTKENKLPTSPHPSRKKINGLQHFAFLQLNNYKKQMQTNESSIQNKKK